MSSPRHAARHVRLALLVAGLLAIVGYFVWLVVLPYLDLSAGLWGTPLTLPVDPLAGAMRQRVALNGLVLFGAMLLTQWLFLMPRRGWRFRVAQRGRPMLVSVIAAAVMAMMLSIGLIMVIGELLLWVTPLGKGSKSIPDVPFSLGVIYILMAVMWIGWAILFWLASRRSATRLQWMTTVVRRLVAGSILELFVATTTYLTLRPRDEDCYCARGSYSGLVFGATVLVWAFGPGIILLIMRDRVRRSSHLCVACGYDLRGSIAAGKTECPECGSQIEPDRLAQPNAEL